MISYPKLPLKAEIDEDGVWLISDADGDEVAWLVDGDKETADALAAGPTLKAINAELVKALEAYVAHETPPEGEKLNSYGATRLRLMHEARAVLAKARGTP